MELDIFNNDSVPNSTDLKEPPCTGMYLILQTSAAGTDFAFAYYRVDNKQWYMNLECPKDRTLAEYWMCEVEEWILLKKLSENDFQN